MSTVLFWLGLIGIGVAIVLYHARALQTDGSGSASALAQFTLGNLGEGTPQADAAVTLHSITHHCVLRRILRHTPL